LADLIPRAISLAEVERKARLDGLTQLANRGEFDRHIDQQLSIAARQGTSLSLLMFDLDRFKSVNDSCGHRGGDAVLRAVADVIRDCMGAIRSADREKGVRPFVARYGGEELAVIVQLDALAARRIGEFIRTRLEMQSIDFEGQSLHVTTSAGLATFPDHADTPEELIAAADAALYQAKANGRNRIEVAVATLVGN
jgi:diguanylate cyclase (GGDEF)-like protein